MLTLALIVAGCAGYFSVWGLSQLFAGASTAVIIMATGLEIGKIITTTALHRYWKKIASGLKIYLTISVAVLMIITSAGIYGFLSNAYQKTANKLEIQNGQVSVLESKKTMFKDNIESNQKIIDQKNKRIDQLTQLRSNQETRLDGATSNRNRSNARTDIQEANTEIQKLTKDIDEVNLSNVSLNDSISKYNTQILELTANSEISGEVGPLKYISELTGVEMAKVVNFLILLLIFVFDPLAVALVLMTNRIFEIEATEEPKQVEPKIVEPIQMVTKEYVDDTMKDESHDDDVIVEEPVVEEEVVEEPAVEEPTVEKPAVEEPAVEKPTKPTKITVEDIKEVKDRNFSVKVPQPKSNTIQRIGSNKFKENGDNNKFIYRKP
jgi:hypothetical protein